MLLSVENKIIQMPSVSPGVENPGARHVLLTDKLLRLHKYTVMFSPWWVESMIHDIFVNNIFNTLSSNKCWVCSVRHVSLR